MFDPKQIHAYPDWQKEVERLQQSCVPEADFEALRDVEIGWLARELGASIASLGYPVGCGIAPRPKQLEQAASRLFDRYAKMIRLARGAALVTGE